VELLFNTDKTNDSERLMQLLLVLNQSRIQFYIEHIKEFTRVIIPHSSCNTFPKNPHIGS